MKNKGTQIKILFSFVLVVLIARIFYLQIWNNDYTFLANKNIVSSSKVFPQRGLIKDRNGEILVYNEPIFNIKISPKKVQNMDVRHFCQLFNISEENFNETLQKAHKYSANLPYTFVRNIPYKEFCQMQDKLVKFKDIIVEQQYIRRYKHEILANVIGYVNKKDKDDKCVFGVTGLEKQYDDILTGQAGIRYDVVNVFGHKISKYKDGEYDIDVEHGKDIFLTIDYRLQQHAEELLKDFVGSIVAIQPQTGEILTMASSPTYNPNALALDNNFSQNYFLIQSTKNSPLLNRTIMSAYAPASTFKILQGLAALDMDVVNPHTLISCNPSIIKCHSHKNPLNIVDAIANSCNYFFVNTFQQMLKSDNPELSYFESTREKYPLWRNYIHKFLLFSLLGVDLPNERAGVVPTVKFYDRLYGKKRWHSSMIRSLSIGQGEIAVTPLQLANLAAIFANKGYCITPHINKNAPILQRYDLDVNKKNMDLICQGMRACLKRGNGWRANVEGIEVCGKTGTAQNHNQADHSVFVAFAPMDKPEIAVAIYLEHAGWGAVAAASMCSQFLTFYFSEIAPKIRN